MSRLSGFARVVLTAAVLGPTYLGNLFQTVNLLPWILFDLAIGALLGATVVPLLVEARQYRDDAGSRNGESEPDSTAWLDTARALTAAIMGMFLLVAVLAMAAVPVIAKVLAVGIDDGGTRVDFDAAARFLLYLIVPQLAGYGLVAVFSAIQHSRNEFRIPAAASIVENVIMLGALVVFAVVAGTGKSVGDVSTGELAILGLGSTAGVTGHVALQWWGARRVGFRFGRASIRHASVTALLGRARSAFAASGLNAARMFAPLLATGTVPGGTVAYQVAFNVLAVPTALGARSLSTAFVPRGSELASSGHWARFGTEYRRIQRLNLLFALPAAAAVMAAAPLLAQVLAQGEMRSTDGIRLLTMALVGIGPAIVGAGISQIAVSASFARGRTRIATREMALRLGLTLVGVLLASHFLDGHTLILAVAASVAVADLCGAALAAYDPLRGLVTSPAADRHVSRGLSLGHTTAAAVFAFLPGGAAIWLARGSIESPMAPVLSVLVCATVGLDLVVIYGLVRYGLTRRLEVRHLAAAAAAGSVALAWADPRTGVLLLGSVLAGVLFLAVWRRPVVAARFLVVAGPLTVGLERDTLTGPFRPNELLIAVMLIPVALAVTAGRGCWPQPNRLDRAVALVLAAGVAWPIVVAVMRGTESLALQVLAAMTLAKGGALYILVRLTHTSRSEAIGTLRVSLYTAGGLGALAVVDVMNLFGVAQLLAQWFPSGEGFFVDDQRASVTIGNPIGLGGYLLLNVVAAVFLLPTMSDRTSKVRRLDGLATALAGLGILTTGQIGVWLAAAAALGVLGWRHRHLLPRLSPRTTVAAAVVLLALAAPVVHRRYEGFATPPLTSVQLQGIAAIDPPQRQPEERYLAQPGSSWDVRWHNLRTYFLPELRDPANVVLGVRPLARADAREAWREFVWIESGGLWLVFVGGLPLLAAFGWMLWVLAGTGRFLGRAPADDGGASTFRVVGDGLVAFSIALGVLMLFDPHLSMRGSSDALFPLLAILSAAATWAVPRAKVIEVVRPGLDRFASRGIDLVGATLALLVLSPLLLGVAVAVRLTSPGPVLFRQLRIGRNGEEFELLKFRSMRAGNDDAEHRAYARRLLTEDEPDAGTPDQVFKLVDPRVTSVGRWIRRFSIDELPQLINVLRGEMALVGPRPMLPWEVEVLDGPYLRRHSVRPGCTGLWQVSGRSLVSSRRMLELDLDYVDRRSPTFDLEILFRTPAAVLRGDGAR